MINSAAACINSGTKGLGMPITPRMVALAPHPSLGCLSVSSVNPPGHLPKSITDLHHTERVTTSYTPLLRWTSGKIHSAHARFTISFRTCPKICHPHLHGGQAVLPRCTRGTQMDQIDPPSTYLCSRRTTHLRDMVLRKQILKKGMRLGHCCNLLPPPLYGPCKTR